MRQVAKKGLITMAAAGGVFAVAGGYAHADSAAHGASSNSPGVLSGNNVQVPVHVPVNACGNTVDVVGALNPAVGNRCANVDSHAAKSDTGRAGDAGKATGTRQSKPAGKGASGEHREVTRSAGGAQAVGGAHGSPGIGSGNNAQVPVHVPVNACGNTVNVVGLLNPAVRNKCGNVTGPVSHEGPHQPPTREREEVAPPKQQPKPEPRPEPGDKPGPTEKPRAEQPPTSRVETPSRTETHMERGEELPASRSGDPGGSIERVAAETAEQLAETGAGTLAIALPAGAGLLLAGTVLYRRARAV
ncbi:chaplin [Streptomyces sp. 71268]|uniref:chaplin n=1 Tax=Streptomyces sp. 71268 TaxID=3002640 RepID=UPI0023F6E5B6|nr:chaplin [Streptomyces sp. 71268]